MAKTATDKAGRKVRLSAKQRTCERCDRRIYESTKYQDTCGLARDLGR